MASAQHRIDFVSLGWHAPRRSPRPQRQALVQQGLRQRILAAEPRTFQHREIDEVTLGVAAAKALRHIAHRAQALHTIGVAAVAESLESDHDRPATVSNGQ